MRDSQGGWCWRDALGPFGLFFGLLSKRDITPLIFANGHCLVDMAMAGQQKRDAPDEVEAEASSKRARLALSVVCGELGRDAVSRAEGALERTAAVIMKEREARVEAEEIAREVEFAARRGERTRAGWWKR